ncbi:transmembrane anchor protein [Hydrogenophaga sp.]|uniref:transmembrane anchor protein n=1 Tax=Hydrogenophaga sp. TaxID=1904254 RepID=UPI0027235495|nr:transmembrane anchor protein [Hydrogenophaga sp.]MDO8906258.1 transmembrane anchor protein [Hydrogenophaga sp.]
MYNTDLPQRAELPSTAQLLKSTTLAAIGALVLLVAVVLPSEYGIDPTGVGRALGLTAMGEIKQALAREAATETAAPTPEVPPVMDPSAAPVTAAEPVAAASSTAPPAAESAMRSDEVSVTLRPGEAAEYKLSMREGAEVHFEWASAGGGVNFDVHGDPVNAPRGFYHGYGKGRDSTGEHGELLAAFDGTHGWFWRNRGQQTVTITLKVRGSYSAIKRMV